MSVAELNNYLLGSLGMSKKANVPLPALPALPSSQKSTSKKIDYEGKNLKELSMWQTWKNSNYKSTHLRPLKKSLQPVIKSHVNKWKAANVPNDLINMHAQQLTIEALKDYDPTRKGKSTAKSATVASHVNNRLNRLQRFVVENQNAARIQESRAGKNIRIFQAANSMLFDELKRDPTPQELAERMSLEMGKSVSVKEAKRYISENRSDRSTNSDNFSFMPTDTRMLIKLLPEELTPIENQVFERYYGLNGSPKKKPGEIAKDLQLSGPRVSRILKSIKEKASEYL
tara:strand:+ start:2625 stop:3482 length:858 start_codon:yes stop_codon:yes gene_type:complete